MKFDSLSGFDNLFHRREAAGPFAQPLRKKSRNHVFLGRIKSKAVKAIQPIGRTLFYVATFTQSFVKVSLEDSRFHNFTPIKGAIDFAGVDRRNGENTDKDGFQIHPAPFLNTHYHAALNLPACKGETA